MSTALKHYQERLLELFESKLKAREVKSALLQDAELKELHAYIETLDLDMLTVGMELQKKWGKKQERPDRLTKIS